MTELSTLTVAGNDSSLLQALARPRKRPPSLILYSGPDAGLPFDLEPGTSTIGRAPDAEIHVASPGVSRHHAGLEIDDTTVVVRDLGSVNGTWVNEERIATPVALADGDMLRLGMVVLRYHASHSLEAALHDRVYRTATVDSTTEVYNRRYLYDALRRELRTARHHGVPLALACFDLDHFKQVNDRHGHPAGDAVLRTSAALMRSAVQGSGIFGRLGGEEFAALLPRCDLAAAMAVAEAACRAVAGHVFAHDHRQTVSAGVALLTAAMTEPTDLLAAADGALYAAKHGGRNRVVAA